MDRCIFVGLPALSFLSWDRGQLWLQIPQPETEEKAVYYATVADSQHTETSSWYHIYKPILEQPVHPTKSYLPKIEYLKHMQKLKKRKEKIILEFSERTWENRLV